MDASASLSELFGLSTQVVEAAERGLA